MDLKLQPCEGEAHTGETTLTAEEVQGMREMLEDEEVDGRGIARVATTLRITLSHDADKELVDQALKYAGGGRKERGMAVNLLLTVLNRVFPRSGGGRKFPQQFSPPVRKVLRAMSLGDFHIMGTSDDHKVMYSGDYDLIETHPIDVAAFKRLVKRASKVGHITDIKCGEVPEWQLLTSSTYSQARELKHLGELWKQGIVTDAEVRTAKDILKPHLSLRERLEAKKELRFGVLRWTPAEVKKGVLKFRGRVIRLEDAMRSSGITKVDLVAWVKDKYVEVSNIILWTQGRKPYAKVPEATKSIREDILVLEHEGKFMKMAKRMYSVAKLKGLVQDQADLLDILNSHLGAIYTVVGDLELLNEFPEATTKSKRREQLALMRDRMAKLFFPEFDDASDPRQLIPRLREVLERETKKALEEKRLLPLSQNYLPSSR